MNFFKLFIFSSFLFLATILKVKNNTAATLVWDASSGTVDGYKVYYNTANSSPQIVDVGNTLNYNIDQLPLEELVQYYFSVSAYNTAGESAPCAPVAYTPDDTTPPAPPIGLTATSP